MLKKTFTYINYNDEKVTEECYFNLTKAELANMSIGKGESLADKIKRIVNTKDSYEIVNVMQELILMSYGEKAADGKHFMKSEEIRNAFKCSEPYSMLYMELCTNAASAAAFVKGIIPKDISEKIDDKNTELEEIPLGIQ